MILERLKGEDRKILKACLNDVANDLTRTAWEEHGVQGVAVSADYVEVLEDSRWMEIATGLSRFVAAGASQGTDPLPLLMGALRSAAYFGHCAGRRYQDVVGLENLFKVPRPRVTARKRKGGKA